MCKFGAAPATSALRISLSEVWSDDGRHAMGGVRYEGYLMEILAIRGSILLGVSYSRKPPGEPLFLFRSCEKADVQAFAV